MALLRKFMQLEQRNAYAGTRATTMGSTHADAGPGAAHIPGKSPLPLRAREIWRVK